MKTALLILILLPNLISGQNKLNEVREDYFNLNKDEQKIKALHKKLENVTIESGSILYGYKGVLETMMAAYYLYPMTKLSQFKKGKEIIEQAIQNNESNYELAFLRFAVQTKAPTFLGYNKDINSDKLLIIKSLYGLSKEKIKSKYIQKMVKFMVLSKNCSDSENVKLNQLLQ